MPTVVGITGCPLPDQYRFNHLRRGREIVRREGNFRTGITLRKLYGDNSSIYYLTFAPFPSRPNRVCVLFAICISVDDSPISIYCGEVPSLHDMARRLGMSRVSSRAWARTNEAYVIMNQLRATTGDSLSPGRYEIRGTVDFRYSATFGLQSEPGVEQPPSQPQEATSQLRS